MSAYHFFVYVKCSNVSRIDLVLFFSIKKIEKIFSQGPYNRQHRRCKSKETKCFHAIARVNIYKPICGGRASGVAERKAGLGPSSLMK